MTYSDNLISGATPVIASLKFWNSQLVTVATKDTIGFFNIAPAGYMSQELAAGAISVDAKTLYFESLWQVTFSTTPLKRLVGQITVQVKYVDETLDYYDFPLFYNGYASSIIDKHEYVKLEQTIIIPDDKSLASVTITIQNKATEANLQIEEVAFYRDTDDETVNPNTYSQDAILWGLDADKPALGVG